MKFEKKVLDNHQVEIIAAVDKKRFEQIKIAAARKISKNSKIPGFRPGKAPYDVVKRIHGEEYIEEIAIEDLVNKVYPEVVKEAEIDPYGPGKLDEIISTDPPKYKFIIPLAPEVDIKNYKSLKKAYKLPKVTKAEIDHVVEDLRTNYATAEDVDRASQEGDLVSIKINAKLKNPGKDEKADILIDTPHQGILGDHAEDEQFPYNGFMKEIVGMKTGETKEFSHKYKKDSIYQNLQGKEAAFTVEVTNIKELIKPDVDEEFAKMLGTDSVENMRSSINDQLETSKRNEYENQYFDELLDQLVKKSTIKYPPEMLENEVEDVLKNFEENIAQQNMDLDTYLKVNSREKEEFISKEIEPAAKKRLEQALVIEEVSKVEKIELDQKELQMEYSRSFLQMKAAPDYKKLQKRMTTKGISDALVVQTANRLLHQNTLDRLKAIANGELEKEETKAESEKQADTRSSTTKEKVDTKDEKKSGAEKTTEKAPADIKEETKSEAKKKADKKDI